MTPSLLKPDTDVTEFSFIDMISFELSSIKSPLLKRKNLVSGLSPSVSEKCLFLNQVFRENKQTKSALPG